MSRAGGGGEASDEALAAAANAGDRGALEVLLARHLDRVHAICRRGTGHPEGALDATPEALIAVTRGLHRYDGRALFTTWLYRVATNAALDELRRRKRRPEPAELVEDRPLGGGGAGAAPVESAVAARLDGEADADAAAHLQACDRCAGRQAELAGAREALAAAPVEPLDELARRRLVAAALAARESTPT